MAAIPSLLPQSLNFVEESEAEMLSRYRGFGAGLFPRLYEFHGDLCGRIRFFRDVSTHDVWAVCETPKRQFGVQLDPDIEVICIWDENWHDEVGTWIDAPIEYAVKVIGQRFLTP